MNAKVKVKPSMVDDLREYVKQCREQAEEEQELFTKEEQAARQSATDKKNSRWIVRLGLWPKCDPADVYVRDYDNVFKRCQHSHWRWALTWEEQADKAERLQLFIEMALRTQCEHIFVDREALSCLAVSRVKQAADVGE